MTYDAELEQWVAAHPVHGPLFLDDAAKVAVDDFLGRQDGSTPPPGTTQRAAPRFDECTSSTARLSARKSSSAARRRKPSPSKVRGI